jgi:ABC-2 type transport system permease protein
MWAVCKKELRQYFSSLTGYIAIIVFLLANGLVLFVFENNILDFGYATLDKFFQLSPWILLLLIPAITMRSFSDEFKGGTFEILQTRPLSRWQIIGGKYLGSFIVVFIALFPTIIYIFSIQRLSSNGDIGISAMIVSLFGLIFLSMLFTAIWVSSGKNTGAKFWLILISVFIALFRIIRYIFYLQHLPFIEAIDIGATIGSYIGLFFLAAVFTAIGICTSSFTNNAVVAFIVSLIACALLYYGFSAISRLPGLEGGADYYIEMLGIDFHYSSISRGVIDTRDIIYFVSVIFLFLTITNRNLLKR